MGHEHRVVGLSGKSFGSDWPKRRTGLGRRALGVVHPLCLLLFRQACNRSRWSRPFGGRWYGPIERRSGFELPAIGRLGDRDGSLMKYAEKQPKGDPTT